LSFPVKGIDQIIFVLKYVNKFPRDAACLDISEVGASVDRAPQISGSRLKDRISFVFAFRTRH